MAAFTKSSSLLQVQVNIKDNSIDENTDYSWDENEVESLRNIIKNTTNLVTRLDDVFLLACLRARKFDQMRASELAIRHFDIRRDYPDLFFKFSWPLTERCLEARMMGFLPGTDHKGRLIFILKYSHWDPLEISLKAFASTAFLMYDFLINSTLLQVNGIVVILDVAEFSLEQAAQFTPMFVYHAAKAFFGTYPVRIKEVHIVNANKVFSTVLPLILSVFPRKLKERIYVDSAIECLPKSIPAAYLPCDYGGELPACDFTECNNELVKHKEYFCENEKYWCSN